MGNRSKEGGVKGRKECDKRKTWKGKMREGNGVKEEEAEGGREEGREGLKWQQKENNRKKKGETW